MIVDTKGLTRASVLLWLYCEAFTKTDSVERIKRMRQGLPREDSGSMLDSAYGGRANIISAMEKIEERVISASQTAKQVNYIFWETDLNQGRVQLKVDLSDESSFDARWFDDMYGQGAAQKTIYELRKNLEIKVEPEISPARTPEGERGSPVFTSSDTYTPPTDMHAKHRRTLSFNNISPRLSGMFGSRPASPKWRDCWRQSSCNEPYTYRGIFNQIKISCRLRLSLVK
jgi:hypothetical protein